MTTKTMMELLKSPDPKDASAEFLILQGIVWPAAAGNVAWSLAVVALVEGKWSTPLHTILGIVVLLLLAGYLTTEWLLTNRRQGAVSRSYFFADLAIMAAIVAFAITLAAESSGRETLAPAWFFLCLVFVAGIIGHWKSAWGGKKERFWPRGRSRAMVASHFLALVVLLGIACGLGLPSVGSTAAVALIIALWVAAGRHYGYEEPVG